MDPRQEVESLLRLINAAAYKALDEYEQFGGTHPSLDSIQDHPLDSISDARAIPLKKTIRNLEAACDQLCATLAPPLHTLTNRAQDTYWAALRSVAKMGIADEIASSPGGLHTSELSRRLQVEENKIVSMLRLLATRHCFREVDENVYVNNRLSNQLVSSRFASAWIDLLTWDPPTAAVNLHRSLSDPEFAMSKDPQKSAYMFAMKERGVSGTVYDIIKSDPAKGKIMGMAMVAMNAVLGSLSILQVYPWIKYNTLCDVGSGVGSFCWNLLASFPHMKVVLHDMPETISLAQNMWNTSHSDAVKGKLVDFAPGNFLESIPVKDCDIYYLRNIIHNWPDAEALSILRNVRNAMAPNSRVLIHDYAMRHLYRKIERNEDEDVAEFPLLPNFGAGQMRLYNQDMTMMLLYNAKERTLNEMHKLCEQAGLTFSKAWDVGEQSVLEYVIQV